jgi:hypothetical protein
VTFVREKKLLFEWLNRAFVGWSCGILLNWPKLNHNVRLFTHLKRKKNMWWRIECGMVFNAVLF